MRPFDRACIASLIGLCALGVGSAGATTVTLGPVADATVSQAAPTTNFGTGTTPCPAGFLGSGNDSAACAVSYRGYYVPYVRFDLSAIPAGATINSATLTWPRSQLSGSFTASLDRVTASWAESGITFNTQPGGNSLTTFPAGSGSPGTKTFDVTATVIAWYQSPSTNYGLRITGAPIPPAGNYELTNSRERGGPFVPSLSVDYSTAPSDFSVSGKVLSRRFPYFPVAGIRVQADTGQEATTTAEGTYTLTGVPSGSRTISASDVDTDYWATGTSATASQGINLTANATNIDFSDFACKGGAQVSLSLDQSTANPGETVNATVTLTNANYVMTSVTSYLDLSFADALVTVGTPTGSGWTSLTPFAVGSAIYGIDAGGNQAPMTSTEYLVSGQRDGTFAHLGTYSFVVPITVKPTASPGTVTLKYRGTIGDERDPDSTGSGTLDQQGYNVATATLTVTCPNPGAFSLSSPTNGQQLAAGSTSATLSWAASAGATSYDIYFGTVAPLPLVGNQAGTTRPVSVTSGTTYQWYVIAKSSCAGTTTSTAAPWSFSVAAPGFSVSGKVLSRRFPYFPVPGIRVQADTGQEATTAADGTYTLTGVPSGSRTITASDVDTDYWATGTSSTASQGINLTANATGIDFADFACKGGAQVSLSLDQSTASPGETVNATVTLTNVNYVMTSVTSYLDLSFADALVTVGAPTGSGWTSLTPFAVGSAIYGIDAGGNQAPMTSTEYLVSGQRDGTFANNGTYSFVLPITVKSAASPGTVTLKYRGTIGDERDPDSTGSGTRDQQGYNVATATLTVAAAGPEPCELVALGIPGTATVGQPFTFTVSAANCGTTASSEGALSVSFPGLSLPGDAARVLANGADFSSIVECDAAQAGCLYDRDGVLIPDPQYVATEGGTTSWAPGETKTLTVEVTPRLAGTFRIQFRQSLRDGATYLGEPASGPLDQQGWWVAFQDTTVQVGASNYGTTVITHGWNGLDASPDDPPNWTLTMAAAIVERVGGGRVLGYDKTAGTFVPCRPELLAWCPPGLPSDADGEVVLAFDWGAESSYLMSGYSEAAGAALFSALLRGSQEGVFSLQRLHFIGHSRGTVVNSEAAERLLVNDNGVEHVTMLDPHYTGEAGGWTDTDVNSSGIGVVAWQGIGYADDYYRFGVHPEGTVIPGSAQLDLSSPLIGVNAHGHVHSWYHFTIPATTPSDDGDGTSYDPFWFGAGTPPCGGGVRYVPFQRDADGFQFARLGAWVASRCAEVGDRGALEFTFDGTQGVVNGDLERGGYWIGNNTAIPGWEAHGGGGQGFLRDGRLALNAGNEWREHDYFYVPANARSIHFCYYVPQPSHGTPPDVDYLEIWLEGGRVGTRDLNLPISVCEDVEVPVVHLRDTVQRLKFVLKQGDPEFRTKVEIDDVHFVLSTSPATPLPIAPADGATVASPTPAFEWSSFTPGSSGDPQAGYQLRVRSDSDGDSIIYDTGFVAALTGSTHVYSPGTYAGYDPISGVTRVSLPLEDGKQYHWHVRFRDTSGAWTGWSADADEPQDFFTSLTPHLLVISDGSIAEGQTGTTQAHLLVTLSTASALPVTVAYETSDDTATATGDYLPVVGTLTFDPGVLNRTLSVPVVGDALVEPDETLLVTLSAPTNATLGDGQGVLTILDDDLLPELSIADASVPEGDAGSANANLTVTLSAASVVPVSVVYATADDTALAPGDYASTSGTLTFAPGQTSRTIPVAVVGDTLDEPSETVLVALSAPSKATLADSSAVLTILNDDPVPSLSVGDVTVAEGNSGSAGVEFTVGLSPSSVQQVTVAWATADGTATAAEDYQAASGVLTVAAGATSGTVTVQVNGDTAFESDETFFVDLTTPAHATLGDDRGVGTILNDDPAITMGISDATVFEGNWGTRPATFYVSLSRAAVEVITVDWITAEGTADAGEDYESASGTLTFAPGETSRPVSVEVLGDMVPELDETFYVDLSNAINALITDSQGIGTIADDDIFSDGFESGDTSAWSTVLP